MKRRGLRALVCALLIIVCSVGPAAAFAADPAPSHRTTYLVPGTESIKPAGLAFVVRDLLATRSSPALIIADPDRHQLVDLSFPAEMRHDEQVTVQMNTRNLLPSGGKYDPHGVAVLPGRRLVFADTANNQIQILRPDGIVERIAGTGTAGYSGDGRNARLAQLNHPTGVTTLPNGDVLVADTGNHRTRKIDTKNVISTVEGDGAQLPVIAKAHSTEFVTDGVGVRVIAEEYSDRSTTGLPTLADFKQLFADKAPDPNDDELQQMALMLFITAPGNQISETEADQVEFADTAFRARMTLYQLKQDPVFKKLI